MFSRQMTASERMQLQLKPEKRAEDTWVQKSGTQRDVVLLYLSMLRAAGLNGFAAKVVARDRALFDFSFMSDYQLDDTLVILKTGGKEIPLDPGEKMCPFGMLHWKDSGAESIGESAEGRALIKTPLQDYSMNSTRRIGDISVDERDGITGTFQITLSGQEALNWRQAALRVDEAGLKTRFDRELAMSIPKSVEANSDHFQGLGSLGTVTGKRLILPVEFFAYRGDSSFANEEKRRLPVDMHYGEKVTDQVIYHLPSTMTVEVIPQDSKIAWEGRAVYVAQTKSLSGELVIVRALARAFTFAKAEDYQDLRDFYQKVATAGQAQAVLTLAPAGTGN
jgi:predicted RNA-binding protein YlxR (DUF448 family)